MDIGLQFLPQLFLETYPINFLIESVSCLNTPCQNLDFLNFTRFIYKILLIKLVSLLIHVKSLTFHLVHRLYPTQIHSKHPLCLVLPLGLLRLESPQP